MSLKKVKSILKNLQLDNHLAKFSANQCTDEMVFDFPIEMISTIMGGVAGEVKRFFDIVQGLKKDPESYKMYLVYKNPTKKRKDTEHDYSFREAVNVDDSSTNYQISDEGVWYPLLSETGQIKPVPKDKNRIIDQIFEKIESALPGLISDKSQDLPGDKKDTSEYKNFVIIGQIFFDVFKTYFKAKLFPKFRREVQISLEEVDPGFNKIYWRKLSDWFSPKFRPERRRIDKMLELGVETQLTHSRKRFKSHVSEDKIPLFKDFRNKRVKTENELWQKFVETYPNLRTQEGLTSQINRVLIMTKNTSFNEALIKFRAKLIETSETFRKMPEFDDILWSEIEVCEESLLNDGIHVCLERFLNSKVIQYNSNAFESGNSGILNKPIGFEIIFRNTVFNIGSKNSLTEVVLLHFMSFYAFNKNYDESIKNLLIFYERVVFGWTDSQVCDGFLKEKLKQFSHFIN